jgi:uncharacterized membrane protein YeaQ/YmgE (transglycosylase-associated protein family)
MKNEIRDLNDAIMALQQKREQQWISLKEQFELTVEALKPNSFVRRFFKRITESPEIKGHILDAVIGLSAGYLSNRVFMGTSGNVIKGTIGALFQNIVTNVVSRSNGSIRERGMKLFKQLFKKSESKVIASNKS